MKMLRLFAVVMLTGLAVASLFLPCKSYRGEFLFFKSDQLASKRIVDLISTLHWLNLSFLAVLAPAAAVLTKGSRVERNLPGIFAIAVIVSVMSFYAYLLLRLNLFQADVTMLPGYFLFMPLAVSGCVAFWMMAVRQTWLRIRNRRVKLQSA